MFRDKGKFYPDADENFAAGSNFEFSTKISIFERSSSENYRCVSLTHSWTRGRSTSLSHPLKLDLDALVLVLALLFFLLFLKIDIKFFFSYTVCREIDSTECKIHVFSVLNLPRLPKIHSIVYFVFLMVFIFHGFTWVVRCFKRISSTSKRILGDRQRTEGV